MLSAKSGASPWLDAIDSLFLRLYAMNLRRAWRNAPVAAWTDASFTVDVLLGFPLLFFVGAAWSVLMDLSPQAVGAFGMSDWALLMLVVATGLAIDVPLSRRWRVYKHAEGASNLPAPADTKYIVRWCSASFASCVGSLIFAAIIHKLLG
jgi:hypothetical protein